MYGTPHVYPDSLTTLLGMGTCLTDRLGSPSVAGGAGDVACGAKLTMRGVTGAVPILS